MDRGKHYLQLVELYYIALVFTRTQNNETRSKEERCRMDHQDKVCPSEETTNVVERLNTSLGLVCEEEEQSIASSCESVCCESLSLLHSLCSSLDSSTEDLETTGCEPTTRTCETQCKSELWNKENFSDNMMLNSENCRGTVPSGSSVNTPDEVTSPGVKPKQTDGTAVNQSPGDCVQGNIAKRGIPRFYSYQPNRNRLLDSSDFRPSPNSGKATDCTVHSEEPYAHNSRGRQCRKLGSAERTVGAEVLTPSEIIPPNRMKQRKVDKASLRDAMTPSIAVSEENAIVFEQLQAPLASQEDLTVSRQSSRKQSFKKQSIGPRFLDWIRPRPQHSSKSRS